MHFLFKLNIRILIIGLWRSVLVSVQSHSLLDCPLSRRSLINDRASCRLAATCGTQGHLVILAAVCWPGQTAATFFGPRRLHKIDDDRLPGEAKNKRENPAIAVGWSLETGIREVWIVCWSDVNRLNCSSWTVSLVKWAVPQVSGILLVWCIAGQNIDDELAIKSCPD